MFLEVLCLFLFVPIINRSDPYIIGNATTCNTCNDRSHSVGPLGVQDCVLETANDTITMQWLAQSELLWLIMMVKIINMIFLAYYDGFTFQYHRDSIYQKILWIELEGFRLRWWWNQDHIQRDKVSLCLGSWQVWTTFQPQCKNPNRIYVWEWLLIFLSFCTRFCHHCYKTIVMLSHLLIWLILMKKHKLQLRQHHPLILNLEWIFYTRMDMAEMR